MSAARLSSSRPTDSCVRASPRSTSTRRGPRRGGLGHDAERGLVPACRGHRRAPRRRVSGLDQQLARRDIAGTRRALDVVGAGPHARPLGLEGRRGPGVGADPPPGPGGFVDGVAYQRVAELEAAGDRARANQVRVQQLVEGGELIPLRHIADRRRQPDLERIPRDGRPLDHGVRPRREHRHLLGQRALHGCGDQGRAGSGRRPDGVAASPTCRPGQLPEVEGIAPAEPVQLVAHRPGKAGSSSPRASSGVNGSRSRRTILGSRVDASMTGAKRLGSCDGRNAITASTRPLRRPSQQVRDELDRGGVGPVKVVEREHHRAPPAEGIEQGPHGLEGTVPLGRQRRDGVADQPRQRREDRGQLVELDVQIVQFTAIERRQIVVERIDEHAEGLGLLELGRSPAEHEVAEPLRRRAQLGDQARLADPLLSGDLHDTVSSVLETAECRLQRIQLDAPPGQAAGAVQHTATLPPGMSTPFAGDRAELRDRFRDVHDAGRPARHPCSTHGVVPAPAPS